MVSHAAEGAKLIELCKLGDAFILQETEKVFTKLREGKKISKGTASTGSTITPLANIDTDLIYDLYVFMIRYCFAHLYQHQRLHLSLVTD